MIYIFTQSDCPKCTKLKEFYSSKGRLFKERDAARLKNPQDIIDQEGFITAFCQNMTLPVVVIYAD